MQVRFASLHLLPPEAHKTRRVPSLSRAREERASIGSARDRLTIARQRSSHESLMYEVSVLSLVMYTDTRFVIHVAMCGVCWTKHVAACSI